MEASKIDLPALFRHAAHVLDGQRQALNQADALNHNHGDHMVEIFQVAAQAAAEQGGSDLAWSMERAAELLRQITGNGSAQVYARGLALMAAQFRQRGLEMADLIPYVQGYLREKGQSGAQEGEEVTSDKSSGEVPKALLAALAEWEHAEAALAAGKEKAGSGLDLGYLFGVGMAYMHAKQKGGDRLDVLSETVVSASPLGKTPHRAQSGIIAVRALLSALAGK